jgi:ATP-dependent protease ClpP protease subunit
MSSQTAKQGVRCELSNDGSIDVFITGEISDWTYWEIASWNSYDWKNGASARMHIYSGGGSYFAGAAIKDFLKTNKIKAKAYLYGICGSAATIISCGCDEVYAGEMSQYFIHHAQGGGGGEVITNANEALVKMYVEKTGLDAETIEKMLKDGDKGAIMTAEKALELGFIDGITDGVSITDVTNVIDFSTVVNEYKQNENKAEAAKNQNMNFFEKIKNALGLGGETDEVAAQKIEALAKNGLDVTSQMLELENKFKTDIEAVKNSLPTMPNLEVYAKSDDLTNLATNEAVNAKVTELQNALNTSNKALEAANGRIDELATAVLNKGENKPASAQSNGAFTTPKAVENKGWD